MNKNKKNIPPRKKGAQHKISSRIMEVLCRHLNTGCLKSLRDAQRFVQATDGVQVHVETLRRNLRQRGIKAYVQQRRPDLKPNHVQERYAFAKKHLHWTAKDWKRVMFSDESIVSRAGSFGRKYYYSNCEHKRLLPHQVHPTPQAEGGKIMIWGCITFFGPGDLCQINGTLNSEFYLEVLHDYVRPSFVWYGMHPAKSIFQQDNSRVHTAKAVRKWFDKQKFTVLKWPPNSPDLNIIEYVWAYIKQKLARNPVAPKDIKQLWKRVERIWRRLPRKYLEQLYESMPRRIEALFKSKGGPIKF